MTPTPRPWSGLRPGLSDVLAPRLGDAVDAAIVAIDAELPAFHGGLDGELGRTIRRGVEIALSRFLALLGTDEPALDTRAERVYAGLGEGESRQGRTLDTLLSAYRIGARVTWGNFAAAAVSGGVDIAELVVLAEAIFAYIDEISAASAVGFARQQAAAAGYRDLLRSRLAEALLAGTGVSDPARVRRMADDAGWQLPERLAVALVPAPADGARPTPRSLPDALLLETESEWLALVPDALRRRREIAAGLGGVPVYLGTERPPDEAATSLAHARALRRLAESGILGVADLLVAADHLADLVVAADPDLLAELTARTLAPLDELDPRRREPLEQTLATWLAEQGDRTAVALSLAVHPQTVSYRMARLRELFGDRLDDPSGRRDLALALAGRPSPSSRAGGGRVTR